MAAVLCKDVKCSDSIHSVPRHTQSVAMLASTHSDLPPLRIPAMGINHAEWGSLPPLLLKGR